MNLFRVGFNWERAPCQVVRRAVKLALFSSKSICKGVFTQINYSLFQSIQVLLPKYYFQSTVFTCYITMDEPSTSTVSIVLLLNYIKYHIHHIKNLN